MLKNSILSLYIILFIFSAVLSFEEPSLLSHSDRFRRLTFDPYESQYGSLQFALSYTGSLTWIANFPIDSARSLRQVKLYPYTSNSWISDSLDLAKGQIKPTSCNSDQKAVDFLFYKAEGESCRLNLDLLDKKNMDYTFVYTSDDTLTQYYNLAGGIGLGIADDSITDFLGSKLKSIFSIYLSRNRQLPSHILFGGYDPNFIEDVKSATKINALSGSNWAVSLTSFELEGVPSTKMQFDFNTKAIFDPNTPYIGIPETSYKKIFQKLSASFKNCQVDSSKEFITCDIASYSSITNLKLVLGNANIVLPKPEIVDLNGQKCIIRIMCLSPSDTTGQCVKVTESYKDFWVLGGPFMSHFYTTFSYDFTDESGQITFFNAKKNINMREVLKKEVEATSANAAYNMIIQLGIVLAAFIALVIGYFIARNVFKLIVHKKKKFYPNTVHQVFEEDAGDEENTEAENERIEESELTTSKY